MRNQYYITILGSAALLLASCVGQQLKKGNKNYDAEAYADAIDNYEKVLSKKSIDEAKIKLAESYRLINRTTQAEKAYENVVSIPDVDPQYIFNYGKVLMQNGKYTEAIKQFQDFKAKQGESSIADAFIDACKNPDQFKGEVNEFKIQQVQFNGLSAAYGATPYNFGYIITGEVSPGGDIKRNPGTGNSFLDLYYTKKDRQSGKYSDPAPLKGEINSEYHDGFATVRGSTLYFTRSNYDAKKKLKVNDSKTNVLKIIKAELVNDEWTNLEELPFNSDDFSNGHPTLSSDGTTMYFTSDRPGGYGASDIYSSKWTGSGWSDPVNLGSVINTSGKEAFPVAADGDTLYFSSDGHPGLGGMDVFMSVKSSSGWSKPINMKSPINSSKDDFSYTFYREGEEIKGNISSTRTGSDQIFEFTYKLLIEVEGVVRVKGSNEPFAGAKAFLLNKSSGKLDSVLVGADGRYRFDLKKGFDYQVYASNEGYFANSVDFTTKGLVASKKFTIDLEVDKIEIGKGIVINNIFYDYNKWNIRPDAALELDKMVKLLRDNPNYTVEFGSHTDCRGTDEYNQRLSENRAKAVVKYCTNRDINPKRLKFKGYGESEPKVKCEPCESCSEEQHQLNRRTEFKVIQ